jgi:hypothetical protein
MMSAPSKSDYVPGVDWMKAIGIILIVHGHVAARTVEWLTPPFYAKQVGVALFVVATGFTLARDPRPVGRVLINRLSEIMIAGLGAALVMSVVGLVTVGDLQESNYLPLVGLHVLLNDLPANPTTWYIGTYLHLLLVWAVALRGRSFNWPIWAVFFGVGIVFRAVLLMLAGPHRAYMAVFNWLDLLVLGLMLGGRPAVPLPRWSRLALLTPMIWPVMMRWTTWQPTFPFMGLGNGNSVAEAFAISAAVSAGYLLYSVATWSLVRSLPAPVWVRWIARNTVLIFVAHMPLYYWLEHTLSLPVPTYAVRVAVEFAVCIAGLAFVSELTRRAINQPTANRVH